VVDFLTAKLLIGMNVIGPKEITIDMFNRRAISGRCAHAEAKTAVQPVDLNCICKVVTATQQTKISPRSTAKLLIRLTCQLPTAQNYKFKVERLKNLEQFKAKNGTIYYHMVNHSLTYIIVRNNGETQAVINKGTKLGRIFNTQIDKCYMLDTNSHRLAALDA